MFYLRSIETIISLITLLMAYIISETTAGWFRAWVCKQVGDDTAESLGFLTWNPLVHVDPIGLLFLMFTGIGWGRYVPVNSYKIRKPYEDLKLFCAYFADTYAYFLIALFSLVALIIGFGLNVLHLVISMVYSGSVSLVAFSALYPHYSSLAITGAIILVTLIYFSILLGALSIIINGFQLARVLFFPYSDWLRNGDYLTLIVAVVLIFFFIDPLREYAIYTIALIGHFIASLIGVT